MSTTFKMAALPVLLAVLALLVWQAGLVFAEDTGAEESPGALSAPTVTLTAASACNPEDPRTYLVASHTAVAGADSYQYRVKWERNGSFDEWQSARGEAGGRPWAVSTKRFIAPGETYAVQVRAVDDEDNEGEVGKAQYTDPLGDFPAPDQVAVAYTDEGRTKARLTWQGDARSAGWFAVQHRAVGQKWRSGPWGKASRVGGEDSPYYHDVSGLNPGRGYQFRVTGYTGQCQAGSWSDTVSLWPVLAGSGSGTVHEADGRWRGQEDGPLSARVSAKGNVTVSWTDWVGSVEVEQGEQPEYLEVSDWRITLTKPGGKVLAKNTGSGAQRVHTFKRLPIGQDYDVVVAGFDADGQRLGSGQSLTIRSRHVSAPEPVTGLSVEAGADNLSVAANWTAPAVGSTPKRYVVYLTNMDSGRTRWQGVEAKHRGGGWKPPKTGVTFDGLWPGDTYRVSVQTRNRDSRSKRSEIYGDGWQRSAWVSEEITMQPGDDPSYAKVVPTQVWTQVSAGEAAPPYAIGGPTAYVVLDGTAPGGLAQFDFPNKCGEYTDHYRYFSDTGNAGNQARLEAHKARRDAERQVGRIEGERAELAELIVRRDAETDETQAKALDNRIKRKRENIAAMKANLLTMEADVNAKCSAAYPAVENLSDSDDRFYRIAQTREAE